MPQSNTATAIHWVERGLVPDHAVRYGIRRLLRQRLAELRSGDPEAGAALVQAFVDEVRQAPLALLPEKANEQHFVERDAGDWMTSHFFAGGTMPSDDLPRLCQDHLRLLRRSRWDGTHCQRTAAAWLANMDARREALLPQFVDVYGSADAELWWMRWRLFLLSAEELVGWDAGRPWWVSHYLFEARGAAA